MLTTQQAADQLGVSRRRVNELINLGTIKAERFGGPTGPWQVDPASVATYNASPRKAGRKAKNKQKPSEATPTATPDE